MNPYRKKQVVLFVSLALIACVGYFLRGGGRDRQIQSFPQPVEDRQAPAESSQVASGAIDTEVSDRVVVEEAAAEDAAPEIRFTANPSRPLRRGKGNLMIYPDATRIKRTYSEGSVFNESIFRPLSGELQGALTVTELTQSAVEASMNLASVERFLKSDAEYLPIIISASESLLLQIDEVIEQGEHTVMLSGRVKDQPNSEVLFAFHDGAVAGSIALVDRSTYYEYGMAGNGSVAIRTLDTTQDIYGECGTCAPGFANDLMFRDQEGVDEGAEAAAVLYDEASASSNYTYVIDGAISYSTAAMNTAGGVAAVEAKILLGVGFINQTLINSDILDTYVAVLGTVEEVGYTKKTSAALDDLAHEELAANDLMDLVGADFVCHIYDGGGGYANIGTGHMTAGISAMGSTAASFPHEFGHTMGAQHGWGDTSGANAALVDHSDYAWRFVTPSGQKIRTLMSYNNGWPSTRIGYYSSPDNYYETVRMGAEPGYDASDDPTVDPQLVNGGGSGVAGAGYDGSNPLLGADNRAVVMSKRITRPQVRTRVSHAVMEPLAESILFHGHTETISWLGGDDSQTVSIELYKGGVFHSSIATVAAHLRWQDWTVPVVESASDYTVRITFDGTDICESGAFVINDFGTIALDLAFTAFQDIPATISLPTVPGVDLSYHYTRPVNGTLSGAAPHLVYTSHAGGVSDSFTYYTTFDGQVSEVKSVSIEVVSPIAYWPLDDASGDIVSDASGNGHDGTRTAATWVDGLSGGALEFNSTDGIDDFVTLPSAAFATISNEISIAMWVYGSEEQPGSDYTFGAFNSSRAAAILIRQGYSTSYGDKVYWGAGYGGFLQGLYEDVQAEDYKGQWNHYVFTKNTTTEEMHIYLNGTLFNSRIAATTPISDITEVYLGCYWPGASTYNGLIDEVRLYDVEMSAVTVLELYQHDLGLMGDRVYSERNSPGAASWSFNTLDGPSSTDYADVNAGHGVSVTTPAGTLASASGSASKLNDGAGQSNNNDPSNSVLFDTGAPYRVQMDLRQEMALSVVNTYSWHSASNQNQRYDLYYSVANTAPASDGSVADLEAEGWVLLTSVDTGYFTTSEGQIAVTIQAENGSMLSYARYLLWDLQSADSYIGEFDVFGAPRYVTAAFPFAEDFESFANGAELDGSNGWTGSGSVVATNYSQAYSGAQPLPESEHTQICDGRGDTTLLIEPGADLPGVWFDSVVQFGTVGHLSLAVIPENAQAWFGIDSNQQFNVYHAVDEGASAYSNGWTPLTQTSIAAQQWLRLTVETSYATVEQPRSFFRVYLNSGNALSSSVAYRDRDDSAPAIGGTWFLCANQGTIANRISQVQLDKIQCDDIVLSTESMAIGDALDRDSDGMPDWQEDLAGTDSTNDASLLEINGMNLIGNQLTFDWQAVSGKNYTVWFATNLMDAAWQEMTNGIPGIEPAATSTIQTETSEGFIRIEVEP